MFTQRNGNPLAAFDIDGGGFDVSFHHRVANRLRNNLQHLQNGHAAADQRSEGARESNKADLMRDGAENRELDPV